MVTQYDGGEEWPFSETVFFVTSATPEEITEWLGELYAPDDVWVDDFSRAEKMDLPEGMHVVAARWD